MGDQIRLPAARCGQYGGKVATNPVMAASVVGVFIIIIFNKKYKFGLSL